jgi:uncharacterized glyoxalase superfamily protein PhnB
MALELYMLGLIVQDMSKALEFYRRLGLAIPAGSDNMTHVEVKMGSGLTFFLDSRPSRWDPKFVGRDDPAETSESYRSLLEFYVNTQAAVEAKYTELISLGYQSRRAPYETPIGMCFAMIDDPDGNTILLSGDLRKNGTSNEGEQ